MKVYIVKRNDDILTNEKPKPTYTKKFKYAKIFKNKIKATITADLLKSYGVHSVEDVTEEYEAREKFNSI